MKNIKKVMTNKSGFVLAETLVVTLFVLVVFNVLYNSAIPLVGEYERISHFDDLDVTYELYQFRKIIERDDYYETITNNNYVYDVCNSLNEISACDELSHMLGINFNKDELIFVKKEKINDLKNYNKVSNDIKEYLEFANFSTDNVLILNHDGNISYINMRVSGAPMIKMNVVSGTVHDIGYRSGMTIDVSCEASSSITSYNLTLNNKSITGTEITNTATEKVNRITLSDSGLNKLTISCKSNNKTDSKSKSYTIYVNSRSETCGCETYKSCANPACGTEVKTVEYDGYKYEGKNNSNGICKPVDWASCTNGTTCTACKYKVTNTVNKTCQTSSCGCTTWKSCWHA